MVRSHLLSLLVRKEHILCGKRLHRWVHRGFLGTGLIVSICCIAPLCRSAGVITCMYCYNLAIRSISIPLIALSLWYFSSACVVKSCHFLRPSSATRFQSGVPYYHRWTPCTSSAGQALPRRRLVTSSPSASSPSLSHLSPPPLPSASMLPTPPHPYSRVIHQGQTPGLRQGLRKCARPLTRRQVLCAQYGCSEPLLALRWFSDRQRTRCGCM